MAERPWAAALERLIRERKGLKKGDLARLCPDKDGEWSAKKEDKKHLRAGTISAVLVSDVPPGIPTLQRIIVGLDRWARLHPEQHLPSVELWEFFVSEEEAAVLRDRDSVIRSAVDARSVKEEVLKELVNDFRERTEKALERKLKRRK